MGLRLSTRTRSDAIHETPVKSLSDDNLTWYNRPIKASQLTISDANKQVSAETLTSPSISAHAWSATRDVISRLRQPEEPCVSKTCQTIRAAESPHSNVQTAPVTESKRTRNDKEQMNRIVENILEQAIEFLVYEIEPVLIAEYYRQQRRQNNNNNTESTGVNVDSCTDNKQLRYLLIDIIGNFKSDEFATFCHLLREVDSERRTVDLLEALDVIVKVLSPCGCQCCSVATSNRVGVQQSVNVMYTDTETKAALPFNYVESLKRSRHRKSRLILGGQHPAVVLRDTADRYVPMLSMKLEGRSLCERQIRQVERLLEQFTCVRELAITNTMLDPPSVLRISRVLQLNTQLYSLNLHNTQLGNDGVLFLTYSLRRNSMLRVLKLSENQLTCRTCLLLSRCILGRSRNITELDLSDNKIMDEGCRVLSGLLANNKSSLRVLSINNTNIGCQGASALFNSLRHNTRLTYIDISHNSLGDSVLRVLSEILLVNRTLVQLLLVNCQLSDSCCASMSRSLKTNTTLRTLRLDKNTDITDIGLESLAESLKYNRSLEHLGLSHCSVGNTGWCCLVDALRYNVAVKSVDLRANPTLLAQQVDPQHVNQQNIHRQHTSVAATNQRHLFYCQNNQLRILLD